MSFKFFRKYNKWLLPIGGSILMVLFLIPQATSLFAPSPSERVVAELAGDELTVGDLNHARAQIQVVASLLPGVRQYPPIHPFGLPTGDSDSREWVMLRHLAHEAGIFGSTAEVMQYLQGEDAQARVEQLASEMKVKPEAIVQALRDYIAIVNYKQLSLGLMTPTMGARVNEVGLRNAARSFATNIDLQYVPIRASWFIDQVEQPTEEQLIERFNLSRDKAPGEGQYGFGYRLPWRVKLEYIAVPYELVEQAVEVRELDVRQMFEDNPRQYGPPIPQLPPTDADQQTRDAYQAAVDARQAWDEMSFNEQYRQVRDEIRQGLIRRKAANLQQEAIQFIESELRASLREVPIEPETGYKDFDEAPEDYQPLSLEELAETVQADDRFGFLPTVVRLVDRFRNDEQLAAVRGFGDSFLVRVVQGERVPVPTVSANGQQVDDYISTAREINPELRTPFTLQVGVPSLPVQDPMNTRYVFRLTEARPAEPPVALEEVRSQVVRDVKLLKAFGRMQQQQEQYLGIARDQGLSTLAEQLNDETIEDVQTQTWQRVTQAMLAEQMSRDFARSVFDQIVRPVEEAGGLEEAGATAQVGAVPYEDELSLYVMQLTDFEPISAEMFSDYRSAIAMQVQQLDQFALGQELQTDPFGYEQLKTLTGYIDVDGEDDDEEDEPTDADQADPAEDAVDAEA